MKRFTYTILLLIALASCNRPSGEVIPVTLTADPQKIAEVGVAVQVAIQLERQNVLAFIAAETRIENVRISRDGLWAVGWLIPYDPQSGEPAPIEPGLALLQRMGDDWRVWLPTTNGWIDTLMKIPVEILPQEFKDAWARRHTIQAVNIPTAALGGYLLPWEAGITRRLTQSTCHDEYIPSGNAHYSFDFSTYGELWNIYAAKAGQVWLWKDDVPTCYEYTCSDTQPLGNYIVIKDVTTDPVTYQLYLHLKQDSIPAELKVQGTPVAQGQFIGNVDNTGQSWGHHLHFQVQVPLYGENYYWGRSIDITFDDVDINGGRPRVQNAWCNDAAYCDVPGDVCNDFRENYTSQNTVVVEGPGRIFFPFISR